MKLFPYLFAVLLFGLVQSSFGQISVSCEPVKKIYVAHEPVDVTVSILNRAGRDLVLNGKAGGPWLTFSVYDGQGHMISPRVGEDFEPVIIPSGQALKRNIPLNSLYTMSRKGLYRVNANVYFAPNDRYFPSRPVSIQISDGVPFWSQVVGIPDGYDNAGEYRRLTLMIFNTGTEKHLYFRVQDEETGAVFATYSLGKVITVRDPQQMVDRENRLHILHMGAPQTYQHTIVSPTGEVIGRDVYREGGMGRPRLSPIENGDIIVLGGVSQEEEEMTNRGSNIRKLSERPPGLPTPQMMAP